MNSCAASIFAIGRETVQRARAKRAAADALTAAIESRGGVLRVSSSMGRASRSRYDSYYVPDVAVHCGDRLSGGISLIPDPVIVVEVISGSTERYDLTAKSIDYFLVPSIRHYLIVDLKRRVVLHHGRGEGDAIPTAIVPRGRHPPGPARPDRGISGTRRHRRLGHEHEPARHWDWRGGYENEPAPLACDAIDMLARKKRRMSTPFVALPNRQDTTLMLERSPGAPLPRSVARRTTRETGL